MSKDALEEGTGRKQAEPSTRTGGFFANLFGHRRDAEVPEEAEPQPVAPSVYLPKEDDYLGRLHLALEGAEQLDCGSLDEHLLLEGGALSEEERQFVDQVQGRARELLELYTSQTAAQLPPVPERGEPVQPDLPDNAVEPPPVQEEGAPSEPAPPVSEEPESPPEPENATCEVNVSHDALTAWVLLLPPLFGGEEVSEALISGALQSAGVTYGIDQDMVHRMAEQQLYFKLVPAARGLPPVNGVDGNILDLVPRNSKLTYKENEDGTIDYKESNKFNQIQAGDVICEISAPTSPVPGMDVFGHPVEGQPGKTPVIPSGKNTLLSDDGTRLIAAIDGQVSFLNGKFQIDSVVTISGDVDSSVGNLDVIGNVVVTGDVLEGFTVKASGNITVSGIVEGAKLIAGGNIQLNRGMNGNMHGAVKAKGDIIAQFLENCVATAKGDIHAQNIINCTVNCDSLVDVTKGRGVIIGGCMTACKAVEAKIIGNSSHRVTEIIMGSTAEFRDRQVKTDEEVRLTKAELAELEKNIAYLEKGDLTSPTQQAKLTKLRLRRTGLNIQYTKKNQQLEEMAKLYDNMKSCYINSNVIYPGVHITMGLETRPVPETMHNCHLYIGADGLVFGSK